VHALNSVDVYGLSIKNVQTYAVSIGIGARRDRRLDLRLDHRHAGDLDLLRRLRPTGASGPEPRTTPKAISSPRPTAKKYTAKVDHPTGNPTGGADSAEWEPAQDSLQAGGNDNAGDADNQASGGGGGYKSIPQ